MANHEQTGAPAHELRTFRGMKVTLMRNFLPSRGLVNGAVLMVVSSTMNTIRKPAVEMEGAGAVADWASGCR